MFKKIENLSGNVLGIHAEGQVKKKDYEKILIPLLEEYHRLGNPIRFLYQLGLEFKGFTMGAAWDNFWIGQNFLDSLNDVP